MGSQTLLTYFSVLNLEDVWISPPLEEDVGWCGDFSAISTSCSAPLPDSNLLCWLKWMQSSIQTAKTLWTVTVSASYPNVHLSPERCPLCGDHAASTGWRSHMFSGHGSREKHRGRQVMSAQHFSPGFGHVYRDTLHYSPNQVLLSSIPGSNQCFVITGISLLIEVWEPLFPGHLMHGEGSTFCK